jgi:hypothetical protein
MGDLPNYEKQTEGRVRFKLMERLAGIRTID